GAFRVQAADVVETLVADAGKRMRLAGEDGGLEAGRLESRAGGAGPQEGEEREDEASAGHEMGGRARDEPTEDVPAVYPTVVGGGRGIVALPSGRCGHLGRARADEIEAPARHRLVAVALERLDAITHAVARGIAPHAVHRLRDHVGGDHATPGAGGEHGGQPRARADLEHVLALEEMKVTAEEKRACLG